VLGGTTIIVSPLISLMSDQVSALTSRGIQATYLASSVPQAEYQQRVELLKAGKWQCVYVSPETLLSPAFFQYTKKVEIPLIAIDEAHCISEWGHDFRLEYTQLTTYINLLPKKPRVIAVTATATPRVVSDICRFLNFSSPRIFTRSFRRDNIAINVISCPTYSHKLFQLIYWLKRFHNQSGIIYSLTRQSAEEVTQLVQRILPQTPIATYHGGMQADERAQVQTAFISNRLPLVSATSAFGMGIDKPNVRFVIHYQLPLTLEEYYQEIGRAGRDGSASQSFMLFHKPDIQVSRSLIGSNHSKIKHFAHLQHYCQTSGCRRQFLLSYFGEYDTPACLTCDLCQPHNIKSKPIEKQEFSRFSRAIEKLFHSNKLHRESRISNQVLQWLYLIKPTSDLDLARIPGIGTGWIKEIFPLIQPELAALRERGMLV
jgi:ATP-dependent DNA helicase RecQ